jgi:hypothetical protein
MTRLCDRLGLKEFNFHSCAPRPHVVDMSGRAQARFTPSSFDVSLSQDDTYILRAHPQTGATFRKVINDTAQ